MADAVLELALSPLVIVAEGLTALAAALVAMVHVQQRDAFSQDGLDGGEERP